jgi:hypothetical protein
MAEAEAWEGRFQKMWSELLSWFISQQSCYCCINVLLIFDVDFLPCNFTKFISFNSLLMEPLGYHTYMYVYIYVFFKCHQEIGRGSFSPLSWSVPHQQRGLRDKGHVTWAKDPSPTTVPSFFNSNSWEELRATKGQEIKSSVTQPQLSWVGMGVRWRGLGAEGGYRAADALLFLRRLRNTCTSGEGTSPIAITTIKKIKHNQWQD